MQNLPAAFENRIREQFPGEGEDILRALQEEPKTSVHLNAEKAKVFFPGSIQVPWLKDGRILNGRPSFTLDPLFHAGAYYPQESSSMMLGYVMQQLFGEEREITCLDLCAAPGGKSLLLSSFLGERGRLVSNELVRPRNAILRENITKWGAKNTIVSCNEPAAFSALNSVFDCIIADAPCSGEGMFRKDPDARDHWSEENVLMCSARQKTILRDVAPALKTGGYLVYSTCTFAREENEGNCRWLIESGDFESVKIRVDPSWRIRSIHGNGIHALQFLPHEVPGEGFFITVLRKTSQEGKSFHEKKNGVFGTLPKKQLVPIGQHVLLDGLEIVVSPQQSVYGSCFSFSELNALANHLYITQPGVEFGVFMRDDFVPAHALALSWLQTPQTCTAEVDLDIARAYLRGDAIALDAEPGWTIITYNGAALGWVKVLSNRVNNYYPKEWRIRMR